MNLQEIKNAVLSGQKVCWSNPSYDVVFNGKEWMIKHASGHCIGLTWTDDVTLNGKQEDFKILSI